LRTHVREHIFLGNICAARNTKFVSCLSAWNAVSGSCGDFNALERDLDVDASGSPRVRLQPIYSDRSLEAIQMRYRENAGVINRRRTSVCHAVRSMFSLLINYCWSEGICFPNISHSPNFPGIFDYYSLVFFLLSMQFVVSRLINSQVNGLEIYLRFLDFKTRTAFPLPLYV